MYELIVFLCQQGNTALHYAAMNGSYNSIKLLFEFGVDPFIHNMCGETAIELACKNSRAKVVRFMFENDPTENNLVTLVEGIETSSEVQQLIEEFSERRRNSEFLRQAEQFRLKLGF